MSTRRWIPWWLLVALGLSVAGSAVLGIAERQPSASSLVAAKVPPVSCCLPAGAHLSISTTHLRDGEPVTIKGNDCPRHDAVYAGYAATSEGPTPIVRHRDGTWVTTPTIPAGTWGPSTIEAFCEVGDTGNPLFTYPQVYAITITTPYTLKVSPDGPVNPGTTLTVQPTASFCSSIDTIYVGVSHVPDPTFVPDNSAAWPIPVRAFGIAQPTTNTVILDASWTTTLTLPQALPAGNYYVVAGCAYSRGTPGTFAPTRIIVG
jgi:hypothetical protein